MLEPAREQRSALGKVEGAVALVQFLAIRDRYALGRYRSASKSAVRGAGGRRSFDLRIDQVLAGGEMSYEAITVDVFACGEATLTAFDAVPAERQAALADVYALLARPAARLPGRVKALGALAPLLRCILGTGSEREMVGFADAADPETGPVPETVSVLREHDQAAPFYMMNLNRYYGVARYESGEQVSGEQAYSRYSARILPYLVSVGGYPAMMGPVVGLLVGDEGSPLQDAWNEFALVYYPSRRNFVRMMSHSPQKGVHHRKAGLQRAVLMPSSERD